MRYLKKYKSINESVDNTFSKSCKVDIDYHGVDFKGREVDEMTTDEIKVSYIIEIDAREWGLKDISSYGFKGPEEITLSIKYYDEDKIDEYEEDKRVKKIIDPEYFDLSSIPMEYEELTLKLNWEDAEVEYLNEQGVYSIDKVEIELENDPKGGLVVNKTDMRKSGDIRVKKLTIHVDTF